MTTSVRGRPGCRGMTLVELIVAMAIVGITFVALYAGMTHGFDRIRLSRENQRATQLLLEKMEITRLYSWAQLTEANFLIPTNFTATYYPNQGTNGSAGTVYTGRYLIEDVTDIPANYTNKLKRVTVTLNWKTGNLQRSRSLSTYVTEFGLHSFAF